MKTFHEVRQDVLRNIEAETELSAKEIKYSFAQIEELAAKEYAKNWVEYALRDVVDAVPIQTTVDYYLKQIDEQ